MGSIALGAFHRVADRGFGLDVALLSSEYNPIIYQNQLVTGTPIRSFNLQTIAGIPSPFSLNAHFGATQYGSVFTLLLGGAYTSAPGVGAEYVMAFQPIASPGALMSFESDLERTRKLSGGVDFAPSSETGIASPIAITDAHRVVR